jgi:crossover junction endodeoxyribonuclease RuvC
MGKSKRIIGIDPGLVHTGWAVIDSVGNERHYAASGVILPSVKDPLPDRLSFIFNEVGKLMDLWKPDECGIEITFVNQNPTTTLLLGHARAAAILAAATRGVPVYEYEPNKIKKAVTGQGHADKGQIDAMVRILLPAAAPKTSDESDAIAIALAHSNYSRGVERSALVHLAE